MKPVEKLYEVMGELLYAVAKADGVIQEKEKNALYKMLKNHPLGSQIIWSFEFEENNHSSVEEMYNKVINFCHSYGPAPQYQQFITAMKIIALASDGMSREESKIINSFSKDLLARFQHDAERLLIYEKDIE